MNAFDIVFTILIPLVLLFAGWMMQFHLPKKQNAWVGYRTPRSMKNTEIWQFANGGFDLHDFSNGTGNPDTI